MGEVGGVGRSWVSEVDCNMKRTKKLQHLTLLGGVPTSSNMNAVCLGLGDGTHYWPQTQQQQ